MKLVNNGAIEAEVGFEIENERGHVINLVDVAREVLTVVQYNTFVALLTRIKEGLPKGQIRLNGMVRPPMDMVGAARKSLSPENFDTFIAKYGENFTQDQLVAFVTEMRYGPRN